VNTPEPPADIPEPAVIPEPAAKRSSLVPIVRIVGMVLVVVLLWLLLTKVANWRDVVAALDDLSWGDWAALTAAALVRVAVEPVLLVGVTPGLRYRLAVPAFLAPAAAATVVPGPSDLAARYAMYRSWGFSATETSSSVILWLLYSTAAKMMLPIVAFGLLVFFDRNDGQDASIAMVAIGVLGTLVFGMFLLLRSDSTARRLGGGAGKAARRMARWFRISTPDSLADDLAERAASFRDQTGHIIRSRSHLAVVAALAQQASLFAILLVAVRAVGIAPSQLDWVSVFAAFALVQLITSVPITPGGLGVAEAAYVTLLAVGSTGGLVGRVAAAALIYRIFSWLILVPLGGISWLWWTRTSSSTEVPISERD